MARCSLREIVAATAMLATVLLAFSPSLANAQSPASSPASAPSPANDGTAIDQGIAYVLMLAALVLTYLIHPLEASYNFL